MIKALLKRTGNDLERIEFNPDDNGIAFYIGKDFEQKYLTKEFEHLHLLSFVNSKSKELDLEPNIFVVDNSLEVPCNEVIRGNILFLHYDDDFKDLTDDEIKLIKDYVDSVLMTDMEKSMIGLYNYDASFVGLKFNKKKKEI